MTTTKTKTKKAPAKKTDEIIDDNQGGEFINHTLEETVPFRYGRVIEFETHQLHRGMAFKIPNVARYSLKFVGKEIE